MSQKHNKNKIEELEAKIKKLEKKQNLLEKVLNILPLGIQIFDKDGISHLINEKQKELLGLPDLSEGIGKFNVLNDPYSIATGASEIYKKAYEGKSHKHKYQYNLGIDENKWNTRKDTRIFYERIVPLINESSETEFVLALLEDITEKETSEKELIQSEARHKDFVNHSPDILYKFSSQRGSIFWSDRVKDILGYEPKELTDDPFLWKNSIHPDDRVKVEEAIKDFEKGGKYSIEYRIKTKENKWIWLHDYFMFKKSVGDEVIIEGHAADITRRKALEIEIDKIRDRFELAMYATNDGIWDWDLLTNEIYYSPNWKMMLGYGVDELPDKFSVWEQLTHPEDVDRSWNIFK